MRNHKKKGITLAKALRIQRNDVVSFVGGGGKTTSMFRLADELSAAGWRVVTTTTTHISQEQVGFAPVSIVIDEIDSLTAHLDAWGQCLIIGAPDGKGRVFGASSEFIAALIARTDVDAVLVEADGSRSRPFKAPGEYEPVVPEATTILVPVVGLNAMGRPLDEDHVHRSQIAAKLAGVPVGSPITAGVIARVLYHPEGGAKALPAGARLVPILNRADTADDVAKARGLAEKLLGSPSIDCVLINSMKRSPSVIEACKTVTGVVLAVGKDSRRGDTSLVTQTVRTADDAGLDHVVVVLGHDAENVQAALAGMRIRCAWNRDFSEGECSFFRKGIHALPPWAGAAVFLNPDHPSNTPGTIRALVEAHRCTLAPACVPGHGEKTGYPVLFDQTIFKELSELSGEYSLRDLLRKYADEVVSVPID